MALKYDPSTDTDTDNWELPGEDELKHLNDFPVAPAGIYTLELLKWEYKETMEKQLPGVNLRFKILDCEDHPNINIFHWVGWKTDFMLKALYALAGSGVAKMQLSLPAIQSNDFPALNELLGTIVKARISVESYKKPGTPDSYIDDETGDEVKIEPKKSNKIAAFI